jgi:hypothetical protein
LSSIRQFHGARSAAARWVRMPVVQLSVIIPLRVIPQLIGSIAEGALQIDRCLAMRLVQRGSPSLSTFGPQDG